MFVDAWVWGAFTALIAVLLALDLFVFHREAHAISVREAAGSSLLWIALGLGFTGVIAWWRGSGAAGEYLAGYLIEKSLSVDNIFVFALLLGYFKVPPAYQHRVLFWGVAGAILFRALFIGLGAVVLQEFHWTIYAFGALLVFTGVRMAMKDDAELQPEHNPVLRLLRRLVPMTADYAGPALWVRRNGVLVATPLVAVLAVVETTDILFAVDSIPAIFAVTSDPFLVFTSNAFAILGLRALYFLLAGVLHRFVYLKYGLAAVLVFVGGKMLASDAVHVDIWLSLAVIGALVGGSIAVSLLATRNKLPRAFATGERKEDKVVV